MTSLTDNIQTASLGAHFRNRTLVIGVVGLFNAVQFQPHTVGDVDSSMADRRRDGLTEVANEEDLRLGARDLGPREREARRVDNGALERHVLTDKLVHGARPRHPIGRRLRTDDT